MRVLDTFMTILVLGILSSTIADEEVTMGNHIGSPERSAILGLTAEDIEEMERDDCEKNGGPTAFTTLTEGWTNFLNCTQLLVNFTELEADRSAALSEGKWDKAVKKYCNKLPNFVQCVSGLVNSTKPCLDAEDRGIIESYHNITSSFLEFMCQKDGARIASFINSGGMQCFVSKVETIEQDCPFETSTDDSESDKRKIPWVELARKDCAVIERFGNCTVTLMQTCPNSAPADLVRSMFEFLKLRKSCPSIPAAKPAPAT